MMVREAQNCDMRHNVNNVSALSFIISPSSAASSTRVKIFYYHLFVFFSFSITSTILTHAYLTHISPI